MHTFAWNPSTLPKQVSRVEYILLHETCQHCLSRSLRWVPGTYFPETCQHCLSKSLGWVPVHIFLKPVNIDSAKTLVKCILLSETCQHCLKKSTSQVHTFDWNLSTLTKQKHWLSALNLPETCQHRLSKSIGRLPVRATLEFFYTWIIPIELVWIMIEA